MKQRIIGITISLISIFVFAELFSLAWYYLSSWSSTGQGELFYTSARDQLLPTLDEEGTSLMTDMRLHPFFGWARKSGDVFNNHGFLTSYDYPFVKQNENQFIVGVFGGSVARIFSDQGKERLIQKLKQNPALANREIIILVFASGGYKQPQQLLILNYYLTIGQEFDLILNIDGFNEVALSHINAQNGLDISMPSFHLLNPLIGLVDHRTLTQDKIKLMAQLERNKTIANNFAEKMSYTSLASTYFVYKQLYKIFFDRYSHDRIALQQLETDVPQESMIFVHKAKEQIAGSALFEQIVLQWMRASVMMNNLSQSRQIPYIHILQPNQYYSKKEFDVEEAAVAFSDDQSYRAGAEQGYPVLVAYGEKLKQKGVHFYDAVGIFDDRTERLYVDDCCHFNQLGNEILADFVAEAILETGVGE